MGPLPTIKPQLHDGRRVHLYWCMDDPNEGDNDSGRRDFKVFGMAKSELFI
jgi:hypothetical protein